MTGQDVGPAPATDEGPSPADPEGPDDVELLSQLDAVDQAQAIGYPIPLGAGISEARATGLLAVYDRRMLHYVDGAVSRDAQQLVDKYGATKTGRYQLRRV